jgi:hypothetical protein
LSTTGIVELSLLKNNRARTFALALSVYLLPIYLCFAFC